jgi:hypothetical protein
MATPQNGESEPSRIIGSISKLAGALVGTAVVAGKRIIGEVTPPSKGPSDKPGGKTMQAPAKRRKKAVRKTETKVPKTKKKKKKVIKRKGTGSPRKSKTSKMKPAPSPAKKKKGVTPKKKTTSRKTKKKTAKGKVSSRFQNSRSSKVDAKMNVPIGKQVPQLQLPIAEAEMVSEKSSSAIASPEAGIEKNGTTEM